MVQIIQDFILKGKRNRPGYKLNPKYITIHDTANTNKGANAKAHANYLKGSAAAAIPASWHYSVDDKIIYQHLPLNENGWHAGDGTNGTGNRQSIGIEICENKDGNRKQAELNAAWLTAKLLKDYNLKIDKVRQHYNWSGKNCPHILRGRKNGWNNFIKDVEGFLNEANKIFYRIICGSFTTWKEADKQIERLDKAGYKTFTVGFILDNVNYIRVVCGSYKDKKGAENHKAQLKKEGFDSFIAIYDGKDDPLPKRPKPEPEPEEPKPEIKGEPLLGKSKVTLKQAKQWAKDRNSHNRFIEIADLYWKYEKILGIRADVLYAQAAHETNFGKYTGIVIPEMNNWAGIKIVNATGDKITDHETFATADDGVRAHFNHISAYAGVASFGEPHGRYYIIIKQDWAGKIKFVEELSGKWAPSKTYHEKILLFYNEMLVTKEPEPEIEIEPEPGLDNLTVLKKILLILEEIYTIIKMLLGK